MAKKNDNVNENEAKSTEKEEIVKLEILTAFTDKYTDKKYVIGDKIQVNKERADELLKNQRKLVKLASK